MTSAIVLEFDAVLLGLGAILVLPLARMPLLKLYWQHATSVLPSCVLYRESSCVRIATLAQLPE